MRAWVLIHESRVIGPTSLPIIDTILYFNLETRIHIKALVTFDLCVIGYLCALVLKD